jgi:signal transduction histidine kinase
MSSLKQKLAFSYGLLIVMILAVSAWSTYHLLTLGRAIDVILVNNYKSILAAENMKEALERQDSAALFFIAGHEEKALGQFEENAASFSREYEVAANNITEVGEREIVADIDSRYQAYRRGLNTFLRRIEKAPVEGSAYYFARLEPEFLALKLRLDDLLHLNQQAMVKASDRATRESRRAEVSTGLMAAMALTIALIFAWRFTRFVAGPITALTEKAKRIGEGDLDQHIDASSRDEIGVLAFEFNRMAARLREIRRTDYGRLLVEQKKSDVVIDSIGEPVIVTDARGQVSKINEAARSLFSGSARNGANVSDLSLSGLAGGEQILGALRDAIAMHPPVASEDASAMVPITIGGSHHSFRLRATPMRDSEGHLLGAVTLLEDVTALAELDKLKTEFISLASSKLREPLDSLRLGLHALTESRLGELNEEQTSMLEDARDNAERLDELLGDLLELAEIESGALKLATERVRPIDLARDAVERFRFAADSKHIILENNVWPDVSWVIADRKAAGRILDNLLSNAIRHTGRDGRVIVEAREGVGRIFFSVRDTGEGIPEKDLPAVFGRFVQLGAGKNIGLGLALVKRLVEAQGGQVSVESRVGEGSIFTFSLPAGGPSSVRTTGY